jgi:hypothetical protein
MGYGWTAVVIPLIVIHDSASTYQGSIWYTCFAVVILASMTPVFINIQD